MCCTSKIHAPQLLSPRTFLPFDLEKSLRNLGWWQLTKVPNSPLRKYYDRFIRGIPINNVVKVLIRDDKDIFRDIGIFHILRWLAPVVKLVTSKPSDVETCSSNLGAVTRTGIFLQKNMLKN